MAKKHPRSAPATTHVTTRPAAPAEAKSNHALQPAHGAAAAAAITAGGAGAATVALPAVRKEPRDAVTQSVITIARILGSLQLAVILLSIFASVVMLGTLMEHWYGTRIAQELLYRAWWFNGLLLLLTLNIFFAAAKKWPFKKHQTGFVITHMGLITMLAGGLLNSIWGTDAQMQLIDSSDPEIHQEIQKRFGYIPQSSSTALYSDTAMIHVTARDAQEKETGKFQADFWPGALAWHAPLETSLGKTDWLLHSMNFLHAPLGHWWSQTFGTGTRLEVLNYYPLSRREDFSAAEVGKEGFPALKLQLRSPRFGRPLERWLGANPERRSDREMGGAGSPIHVEILGECARPMLEEFLQPPSPEKLGQRGVLAVRTQDKTRHIRIDGQPNTKIPVGTEGLAIRITNTLANELPKDIGEAVSFELWNGDDNLGEYLMLGRLPYLAISRNKEFLQQGRAGLPWLWYHAPSAAGSRDGGTRGVLQFMYGSGGEPLYYRSFVKRDSDFVLDRSGRVNVAEHEEYPIWDKMAWNFRILEYLPQATARERYLPVNIAPGKETEEDKMLYPSAILCRLTSGAEKKEFWVQKDQGTEQVTLAGNLYSVRYTFKQVDLGFKIKLERAEQTVDPGTGAAASYTSYVQLYDDKNDIHGEHRIVTMNEPLEHQGYKFYQSTYNDLQATDNAGKPVSLSGFTIGYDPGLGLKYRGSLMLGIGIAIMFYMKAYFFKPVRRPTVNRLESDARFAAPAQAGLGQLLLLLGAAVVLLLYLAIPIFAVADYRFDAGQFLDLFLVTAVLYCVWAGMDWARTLCLVFGLVGGIGLLVSGLQAADTLSLSMGVVYVLFAGILLLPPVRAFLQYQMQRRAVRTV